MKNYYLILFLCLGLRSFSQTDTSKWDPNDPNCPCHKLAQQADDEWKRMQNEELNEIGNNSNQKRDTNIVLSHDLIAYNTNQLVNIPDPIVVQNSFQSGNDSTQATTSTTNQVYTGSSGGSSYYHYSGMRMKWRSFCRKMAAFRSRMGSRRSGTRKRKWRVVDCFEF